MAVQSMKMVYLFDKFSELNELTEVLTDNTYFQPELTTEVMNNSSGFVPINEENPYAVNLARLTEIMNSFGITDKKFKKSNKSVSEISAEEFLGNVENKLHEFHSCRDDLLIAAHETDDIMTSLEHFKELNIELSEITNTEFVHARFGRLPKTGTKKLNMYSDNPYAAFFVASSDGEYDWGIYFKPDDDKRDIDRLFASLFFERIEIPQYSGTPKDILENLRRVKSDISDRIEKLDSQYKEFVSLNEHAIYILYNQVKNKSNAFDLRHYAARYNDSYMLVGWVPADKFDQFKNSVQQKCLSVVIESDSPNAISKITPPTKLKNRWLFRPFQYFVEIYGVPNYGELDPTVFVAITYTILYGIMFADLGQGIVLALAGYLMYKLKRMDIGKILIPCGISGAFFGCIFGSVFGFEHVLDPIYKMIGFREKPIDVMSSATTLLAFSIGIGVVLVIVAMVFNVFSKIKKRDIGNALFGQNGVCGIMLYSSILLVAGGIVFNLSVPTVPVILIGIVLPLILIFLEKPLSGLVEGKGFDLGQSVGDYILENFFELFEVLLSYFTNTLSFLRVGAFVLIHAGMMTAFFALAEIMGSGAPYVIMIIFGNIFVTALEGLLVAIQVLRLEFYEMFSRFYIGDGRLFTPLKSKHK